MEDHRTLFREVFGDSSGSSEEDDADRDNDSEIGGRSLPQQYPNSSSSWEQVSGISGLWLCRNFLSPDLQSSLLSAIYNEGWFTQVSQNQAMRFGDLPAWATQLSNSIRELVHLGDFASQQVGLGCCDVENVASSLPSPILWRDPLFDQLIVNVYQPGEGICAHVDLMRFDDGIAIVSLESSCVMHFTKAGEASEAKDDCPRAKKKLPVHLTPGSLVLMWGEARYLWTHEINRKPGCQVWEGQEIHQKKRTSITLRKLRTTDFN